MSVTFEPHWKSLVLNDRFLSNDKATIGQATVYDAPDHAALGLYLLEDAYNWPKIPGKSRIPAGVYEIVFRKDGGMYPRYRDDPRLQGIGQERGMLWLTDVTTHTFVYYHIGNDEDDTDGCPLTGETYDKTAMKVFQSVKAYRRFYPLVAPLVERGGCYGKFVDNDRK